MFLLFISVLSLNIIVTTCDETCDCEEIGSLKEMLKKEILERNVLQDIVQKEILERKMEFSRLRAKIRRMEASRRPEPVSIDALDTEMKECFTGQAHDYMTTKSTTASGLECQRWDHQYPHEHKYKDEQFPDGSKWLAKNYCRDPGYDGFTWCYTTDPNKRWETCGILWCDEPARNNNTHDCYTITNRDRESGASEKEICERKNKIRVCAGIGDVPFGCEDCDGCCQTNGCSPTNHKYYSDTWHRGESGRECQRWDSQFPHKHENDDDWRFPQDGSASAASNFCRDPVDKDSGFLWCYTMDPNVRWEKCAIPYC